MAIGEEAYSVLTSLQLIENQDLHKTIADNEVKDIDSIDNEEVEHLTKSIEILKSSIRDNITEHKTLRNLINNYSNQNYRLHLKYTKVKKKYKKLRKKLR